MKTRDVGLACALFAFTLDQTTKALALAQAPRLADGVEILPMFNLVLVHNTGVSFGLFGLVPWWALVLLGLAIVAGLAVCLWRARSRLVGAALGLMIGGALGNVLDRARHGAVTDFLDFYLGAYHWPAFNLADVAVVSGAGLLLLDSIRAKRPSSAAAKL
ncbi:signal peptidase II [Parvibaculum sp.]|jgi:signal peptidase II|uniref:signal peptidase II n=1 Tax=Alphaproteobacteria TaxID=28211 RepID=UPI000C401C60|nr:signal peptidase II [Parvibaculum sp.]MAC40106.1 signal peptidase II [Oceanicaulis sp.]MAU62723.1 signal peptidase II [Parvibaculum sp.]|tara:strand:- start:267 stop:746 length:480 start_codon:yes stop_codon:yes gene_type:complete